MDKIEKKTTFDIAFLILAFLLFPFASIPVYSQEDLTSPSSADDSLDQELRYLQAETYVITASRIPENIKKTAASITVVTDREIQQMGARNLIDVLETVPGWGNYFVYTGVNTFNTRGAVTIPASSILVMINSHPINDSGTGGAAYTHDTLILDNVKRIEFVRGPGSALYGANAFSGVINIITKEAEDVDGWELLTRGGSYDTQQYNVLYGKTHKDLEVVFNYNYFNTHGFNGHVNEDQMSLNDRYFLFDASLAPGRMQGDDEKYDGFLNLKYKGFTFDGRYVDRKRDQPVGSRMWLNPESTISIDDYYLKLSYERTFWEKLDFLGKVYRNHNDLKTYDQTPPLRQVLGILIPIRVFRPEGLIDKFSEKNKRTGFEIQTTYRMNHGNTVLAGVTYEEMKVYDVRKSQNWLSLTETFEIPLSRVVNVSDLQNSNQSDKRNFKAFFIEDMWDITENLRYTTGVRWDDYSDFGSEVSPRAGLTWEFIKGYDLKLLYGRAFRAPTFQELSNPDLDPETVDTFQISMGAEFIPSFSSRVTWFRNRINDAITYNTEPGFVYLNYMPGFLKYINRDTIRSEGLELEMKYDLGRGSYLALNYRYMISQKRYLEQAIPRHIGNIMANIRLSRYLNFYASCHIQDGFRRDRWDDRDDASGYGIVNTTLIAKKFLKKYEGLEVRGSIYNLFDKDYVSPQIPSLPQDIPRPGRNFLVEVKYKF